ncbi:sister chromatid cohesion protein PDS5 [Natrinema versiforme]|uniref:HEAT repeat protein n=1 Tax=Natrinema versiforme JCM 10478 TaxID=1227496 RepID=L9XN51_9EURY|nr:sister chromatid cohesion protein PDS5 [Natrinema versiforme]ELY63170.1 HEAT repeat protein [Natrinema versiforme JCM 10478]
MDDSPQPSSVDRLEAALDSAAFEEAVTHLERVETHDMETRKAALQTVTKIAETQPSTLEPILETVTSFLTDEERSVRLTTAKLFVEIAAADPDGVSSVVPSLAARLADDDEFYFVRARSAEALGYVALEHPETAATPEVLADLRIGLSFDEPEVREKLAKALEFVALGDQNRLRHHVGTLTESLDDPNELVRYHLCTALVVIGCTHPDALSESVGTLRDRLDDENPYVRGRAVEALGVLERADADVSIPDVTAAVDDDPEQFLTARVRFATGRDDPADNVPETVGSIPAIRDRTDELVAEITAPDGDECPNCGLVLPEASVPMCPRCGVPY